MNTKNCPAPAGAGSKIRLLTFSLLASLTTALAQSAREPAAAPAEPAAEKTTEAADEATKLSEYVVVGVKGRPEVFKDANVDVPRTVNDAQPYFIFDQQAIARSGATNIEDFFRTRIPMDAKFIPNSQGSFGVAGNTSNISLRGLGTGGPSGSSQTLILINGRRASGVFVQGYTYQPDLNGIPLSAVERIEILPSSASAIYGASAVGGVVNVILRRDYAGAELKAVYENTFDTDAPIRSYSLTAGLALENGKTNVMISASYSDEKPLMMQDRDFYDRGVAKILATSPSFILAGFNPPLGATPNIKSQSGAPLFGPGTPNITYVPTGYQGGGGLAPFLANAGKYNLAMPDTSQGSGGRRLRFTAGPRVKSLNATLRRQFTSALEVFFEFSNSSNITNSGNDQFYSSGVTVPASAPNNPFGQAVLVTVPLNSAMPPLLTDNITRRYVAGFTLKLPHDWKMEGDYTFNQNQLGQTVGFPTNYGALFAAYASGAIDVFTDTVKYPPATAAYTSLVSGNYESTLNDLALRGSGPLWQMPAGPVILSTGLEHRKEGNAPAVQYQVANAGASPAPVPFLAHSQSTDSAYAEVEVPLVSPRHPLTGVRQLDLQFAGRTEKYDTGLATKYSSTNPTVGLRYRPIEDIMLRASYSTGFLPPSFNQLTPSTTPAFSQSIVDVKRGNSSALVPVATGGNPNLKPEKSKNTGAGLILEPKFLSGLRLAVDYYRIEKRDNIASLSGQVIVNNESVFPGRVTRGPVAVGDPYTVGPITRVDATSLNLTKALIEGYDVSFDYRLDLKAAGLWTLSGLATFTTHFKQQLTIGSPYVEHVGEPGESSSPLKFKGNLSLVWDYHRWSAGWTVRYFDSYKQATFGGAYLAYVQAQGSPKISSQSYHDFFVTYRVPESKTRRAWHDRILDRVEIQVGVKNTFNTSPPLDVYLSPFYFSSFGDARLRDYVLSIKKTF